MDHLVTAILAEIDIEIRHRHPLGVEKSLKQQAPAERIEIGDLQRPSNRRSGPRTTPRPDRNGAILSPLDKIGDDQEVAGKPHLDDDVQLHLETLAIGRARRHARRRVHVRGENMGRQARLQAHSRLRPQFLVLVTPAVSVIGRQDRGRPFGRHIGAALRDDQTVIDRLRQIGEQRAHVLGAFKAMLGRHPPAVLVTDGDTLGDA